MLLLNINKNKAALALPLVLISICFTAGIAFSKEENTATFHQSISNLFESASKENKHLLEGWNDYIIKVLGYSNAEHLKVIEQLTLDYAKAYKALDEKYEKYLKQDKIQYNSEWLDDLVAQFGQDFVCNNERAIMLNLMMALDRNHAKNYDQDAKEIISKEMVLYIAYERYLGCFIKFFNRLGGEGRKKMNAWKEVAEKYLSIAKRSNFAFIYYGSHMQYKILDNVMQKENNELYMFFKDRNFPYGSGASIKARRDMKMFVKACNMQSKTTRE
jgi:hypothetical protein